MRIMTCNVNGLRSAASKGYSGVARKAKRASIYNDTWFPDHAPVVIDDDYKIASC